MWCFSLLVFYSCFVFCCKAVCSHFFKWNRVVLKRRIPQQCTFSIAACCAHTGLSEGLPMLSFQCSVRPHRMSNCSCSFSECPYLKGGTLVSVCMCVFSFPIVFVILTRNCGQCQILNEVDVVCQIVRFGKLQLLLNAAYPVINFRWGILRASIRFSLDQEFSHLVFLLQSAVPLKRGLYLYKQLLTMQQMYESEVRHLSWYVYTH